jgi:CRISPR-associated endonuclease/helicase Cas3
MTHFWAKTTPEDKPGISVYDHMVNVGCVARCIAEAFPALLARFQLESSVVGTLAALHDLGKISPGFQQKCEAWLEENGLAKTARNWRWDSAMELDHGKVSHSAIQDFLVQKGISIEAAQYIATVLGAHHGKIKYLPNARGIRPPLIKQITDKNSGIDWNGERQKWAQQLWSYFNVDNSSITITDDSPAIWWLAGLTSIADWIGSDEESFPPNRRTGEVDVPSDARKALDKIGFRQPEFIRDLSFHELFHDSEKPEVRWVPNEMQKKSHAIVSAPGVYVIEAPMGMGKTEAALWAAYRLLVAGKATGIYFALPTQATSNRMHLRLKEFVRRISRTSDAIRLIHGNSWLTDQKEGLSPVATSHDSKSDDARTGRDWFASAKRALIVPFGIGTVDQALLGVVAAKHFFVRHFALAGKVVILDEVHSYDLYTGTLIDKLISTLESLGCTVIVLSATLTGKRRGQIVSCLEDVEGKTELSYPLITGRSEGHILGPVAAAPPASLTVKVDFIVAEDAADEAASVARNGGAVVWICNTVRTAQEQYRRFKELVREAFPLGLLHSRFPYWRREMIEEEWMGRLDKSGKKRCGSILVSTQIVEQSVDLDADLMITELAPTDMLLQRLGRLWRHERGQRPVDAARFRIIKEEKSLEDFRNMEPKAIIEALGGKAHVYDPFVLLRTLQLWESYPNVVIPTQIRELIEATYYVRDDDPKSWEKLFDDRFVRNSNERFKAAMNSNYWQPQLPDEEGVQTRLNEMPTIALVLCRTLSDHEAVFIDGSSHPLGNDQYRLATAQAIHKNLVKVPRYCFDHVESCLAFTYKEKNILKSINSLDHIEHYIYGEQSVGIVAENGTVKVKGLKNGIRLFYSDELGLVIENSSAKEEV